MHLTLTWFEKVVLIIFSIWFVRNRLVDFLGSLFCGSWYSWKAQAYCKWWGWILPHR